MLLGLTQRVRRVIGIAFRVVHGGRESGCGELGAGVSCNVGEPPQSVERELRLWGSARSDLGVD